MNMRRIKENFWKFKHTWKYFGLRTAISKTIRYVNTSNSNITKPLSVSSDMDLSEKYLLNTWSYLSDNDCFYAHECKIRNVMKHVVMIADLNIPQCTKYRVEQFGSLISTLGINFSYSHYEDVRRATDLLQKASHVVFYRVKPNSLYLYEARRLNLNIMYDIDDPLFSLNAYQTYGAVKSLDPHYLSHFKSEAPEYALSMSQCDLLCLSTPGLAELAKRYVSQSTPITVRRNFADGETLRIGSCFSDSHLSKKNKDQQFNLVFATGSLGREDDFQDLIEPLVEFLSDSSRHLLTIIGPFELPTKLVEFKRQIILHDKSGYEDYLHVLSTANVCLLPLEDNLFNECKSSVRQIDAAACSVTTIASAVGDLKNTINHGEDGYLVHRPEDWSLYIKKLSSNPTLALTMGRKARSNLEESYSLKNAQELITKELQSWLLG